MEQLVQILNRYKWTPEKGETCILLIDLQEYFRGMIQPMLPKLQSIIITARERNIPLIFTQHGHKSTEEAGMLGAWWADLIIKGTPEARVLPELNIKPEDIIIQKNRYNAFYNTDLAEKLIERNIKDLVIGGVMTNLCCETTARDAFVRDYRVFFLADGTSTGEDDYHLSTLKNLSFGFATLMTCAQFMKIMKNWET
jgi:nicotinamidase-related amidase